MIVLDTHIWVNWILGGDAALTPAVVNAMQTESRCAVSAISCFEVSLLESGGKLELPLPVNMKAAQVMCQQQGIHYNAGLITRLAQHLGEIFK